jgi:hypothetical protein
MDDKIEKTFEEWQQAVREFDALNDEYVQAPAVNEGHVAPVHEPLTVEDIKLFDQAWQKVKDKQDAHRKAIENYTRRRERS